MIKIWVRVPYFKTEEGFLVYHVKLRYPCLEINDLKIIVRIFVNISRDVLMSLLHQLLPGPDLINLSFAIYTYEN